MADHLGHVKMVSERFRRAWFVVNGAKCQLGKTEVKFSGDKFLSGKITPLSDKLSSVREFL